MISLTQFCFTNVKCTRTTVSFRKNVLQRGVATKDESATSTRHGDPTREKTTERTSSKLEEASPESFSHPRSIPKRSDVVKNDRVLGWASVIPSDLNLGVLLSEPTIDSFLHQGSDWAVFSSIYYVDENVGVSPVMCYRTCVSVCVRVCVRAFVSGEWGKQRTWRKGTR